MARTLTTAILGTLVVAVLVVAGLSRSDPGAAAGEAAAVAARETFAYQTEAQFRDLAIHLEASAEGEDKTTLRLRDPGDSPVTRAAVEGNLRAESRALGFRRLIYSDGSNTSEVALAAR